MSETKPSPLADRPAISVAIITYNRREALARALDALAAQDLDPHRFEVVIISDGSTDGTDEMVQDRVPSFPAALRLHPIPHGGAGQARNAAMREARADLIAFTDDDCRPRPSWLRELWQSMENPDLAAAGGLTVQQPAGNLFIDYANHTRINNPVFQGDEVLYLITCNAVFRKALMVAAGGFDEVYRLPAAEDMALCLAMRARGGRFAFIEAAQVEHWPNSTLKGFLSTHYRYGRGEALRLAPEPRFKNLARLLWRSRQALAFLALPYDWLQAAGQGLPRRHSWWFPILGVLRRILLVAGQWRELFALLRLR